MSVLPLLKRCAYNTTTPKLERAQKRDACFMVWMDFSHQCFGIEFFKSHLDKKRSHLSTKVRTPKRPRNNNCQFTIAPTFSSQQRDATGQNSIHLHRPSAIRLCIKLFDPLFLVHLRQRQESFNGIIELNFGEALCVFAGEFAHRKTTANFWEKDRHCVTKPYNVM